MVRVPWKAAAAGARTSVRAELVDLYRTLVDLAGLDAAAVEADVQGVSLAPLFDTPAAPPPALAAKTAYSQIARCGCTTYTRHNWTGLECGDGACAGVNVSDFDFMGYSQRAADGWRYTLWVPMTAGHKNWSGELYDELFDLTTDDGTDFDNDNYAVNIAGDHPAMVAQLRAGLEAEVKSWASPDIRAPQVPGAAALLRVALYVGAGTSPSSAGNLTASLRAHVEAGALASLALLDAAGVAALSRSAVDVLVVPGGGGSAEATGLGAAGAAAIEAFVSSGGGYYGTCAGGFLAAAGSCCDERIPGYCGGRTGCSPSSYGLGLIDLYAAEPWNRGHGDVLVAYDDATVDALKLDPAVYRGKNVTVLYYQGPIADRAHAGNFSRGATFATEIASNLPQYTTGQMLGAPAVLFSTHGAGRVLVSPPHPEETTPRRDDVVLAYTLWAGRAL